MQRLFLPRLTFGKSGKRCQTSARIVSSQFIWQEILNWWFLEDRQYFTLVIGYSSQNIKNILMKIGKIIWGLITHASECYLVRRNILSVNRNLNFAGCQYHWFKAEVGGNFQDYVTTSHQIFITYKITKLSSMLSSIFINLGLLVLFYTCSHFYFRVNLI